MLTAGGGWIHGDAAADRGCAGGISATKIGGVEHALKAAAAGVDLAGEKLVGPQRGIRLYLITVGVRREAVAVGVVVEVVSPVT